MTVIWSQSSIIHTFHTHTSFIHTAKNVNVSNKKNRFSLGLLWFNAIVVKHFVIFSNRQIHATFKLLLNKQLITGTIKLESKYKICCLGVFIEPGQRRRLLAWSRTRRCCSPLDFWRSQSPRTESWWLKTGNALQTWVSWVWLSKQTWGDAHIPNMEFSSV